jgi:hypothetical protein
MIFQTGSNVESFSEPPPTRDVNRDSGTASANGGWFRREAVRNSFELKTATPQDSVQWDAAAVRFEKWLS